MYQKYQTIQDIENKLFNAIFQGKRTVTVKGIEVSLKGRKYDIPRASTFKKKEELVRNVARQEASIIYDLIK